MSNRAQKQSVLSKQKPASRKSFLLRNKKLIIVGSIFASFLLFGISFNLYLKKNKDLISVINTNITTFPNKLVAKENTEILLHFSQKENELTPELISDILENAKFELRQSKTLNLSLVAKNIQNKLKLAKVHIFPLKMNEFVITAERRIPFLKIQVGNKTKYLNKDGIVFSGKDSLEYDSMITIKGLFDNINTKYIENTDNSLIVNKSEEATLKEVIELYTMLVSKGLKPLQLTFKEFRGFYTTIEKDNIEIIFGRKPFDKKIDRLEKILKSQSEIGQVSARIELDYEGKAFIKERKI